MHGRRRGGVLAAVLLTTLAASCGASTTSSSSRSHEATTTTAPPGSLQAAAIDWAHTFLTGSAADIRAMQSPSCADTTTPTHDARFLDAYLRGMRAVMARRFGRPLDRVAIVGVTVRNVTGTSDEAQVHYDLPRSVVGNDNWVEYERQGGRWTVADCRAPIGGESTSSSASTSPQPGG